ncbi:lactonohydrolase like protein [Zymoseptoria brevis]|uniref:Lactonohydrolase like protein n=1 Tax=Zymoseptoria brevis TaxID=1047168 RepID=A0A0F4GYJ5_9PEZI|nr:lactonohydrolase like protein [Zymoseptoria brevis]
MLKSMLQAVSLPLALSSAQLFPGSVQLPLVRECGPSSARIVCVERYASVMPYHFSREPIINDTEVQFGNTSVPNDPSFGLVSSANFVVFDEERALDILGDSPTYEVVLNVSNTPHEAPVYVPSLNRIFLNDLAATLSQLVIDLNSEPPTISDFTSDPPVLIPNGGTFHNGLVYGATAAGNSTAPGGEQRPGIVTLDPQTNKSTVLLNNFFGNYFNSLDDLTVDSNGVTGKVPVVEDTLTVPNGIALSSDGKYAYVGDTGAHTLENPAVNQKGPRTVYKFDVVDNGTNLCCKRPFYFSQDWLPDGLREARNGMVVIAAGSGVDVVDSYGQLVLRIQTDFIVQNFAWAGEELKDLWLTGNGKIARVKWELEGSVLT